MSLFSYINNITIYIKEHDVVKNIIILQHIVDIAFL